MEIPKEQRRKFSAALVTVSANINPRRVWTYWLNLKWSYLWHKISLLDIYPPEINAKALQP